MRARFAMPTRRALAGTATALIAGALWAPSPALAASPPKSGTQLTVSPKKPQATDTIRVAFRAGRLRPDERYDVGIGEPAFGAAPAADRADGCTSSYFLVLHGRKPARRLVEVPLYPNGAQQPGRGAHIYGLYPKPGVSRFCAGEQTVRVARLDPDNNLRTIARRTIRIARDSRYPEPPGTPVRITVLEGSSLTVQAPGRPDRTLPVGGVLRGVIPGRFRPNTDISISAMTGALSLSSITPDPLCTGATYSLVLPLAQGGPSKMLLRASGHAELSLELAADPLSLAGCAAPASPGRSALTIARQVTPQGLVRLPISGAIGGVPIAPDVAATVTVNLLVNVDLSGED